MGSVGPSLGRTPHSGACAAIAAAALEAGDSGLAIPASVHWMNCHGTLPRARAPIGPCWCLEYLCLWYLVSFPFQVFKGCTLTCASAVTSLVILYCRCWCGVRRGTHNTHRARLCWLPP